MAGGWAAPTVGDIVWCRFPELPATRPGPKPRPALVTMVDSRTDGIIVRVAYGTSQRVTRLLAGEFSILQSRDREAYALAGLSYDTKFDFKASVDLPWTDRFFAVAPRARYGQTPKLGTLHPSMMRAARAAHAAANGR